jgi:hypothetical protein
MSPRAKAYDQTTFLNVDLDISSRQDLSSLAEALCLRLIPLHVGRIRRTHWARDPASEQPIPDRFEEELTLDVGGLAHDPDGAAVQVRWLQQPLKVGQQITLAIVETEAPHLLLTRDPMCR